MLALEEGNPPGVEEGGVDGKASPYPPPLATPDPNPELPLDEAFRLFRLFELFELFEFSGRIPPPPNWKSNKLPSPESPAPSPDEPGRLLSLEPYADSEPSPERAE
jgi:hypothetical protein